MLNLIRFNTPFLKETPFTYINQDRIFEVNFASKDTSWVVLEVMDELGGKKMTSWLVHGHPQKVVLDANNNGTINCVDPKTLKKEPAHG